jgi:RNA polymerase sigma-70 factor, ECF subfamily
VGEMLSLAVQDVESEALAALDRGQHERVLTILMRAYGKDIYRHCRLTVGEPDIADEVHQTVFVQAFRDLGSYSRRSSLRTWLLGIARHRCLDALKITRRWRWRFALGKRLPEVEDPRAPADAEMGRVVEATQLGAALLRLAPEVRSALLLRFQEGLSFEEMAAATGERATTLQARVARALPKLREMMRKHG